MGGHSRRGDLAWLPRAMGLPDSRGPIWKLVLPKSLLQLCISGCHPAGYNFPELNGKAW